MVESGKSTPSEDLQGAIDQALRSGMDAEAIAQMVAERVKARRVSDANDIVGVLDAPETTPEDAGAVIYEPGKLPEGLIDLPSAAKKYGIKVATLRSWIQLGKLPRRGRLRAPSPGGGYVVTEEEAITFCRDNPRKRGPKPKQDSFTTS